MVGKFKNNSSVCWVGNKLTDWVEGVVKLKHKHDKYDYACGYFVSQFGLLNVKVMG